MEQMKDHYESLLADHYSWLFGGLEVKCSENKRFFNSNDIRPGANGKAIDLGCGSGFQSIPLAQIGFNVTSIDLSPKLLAELSNNKGDLLINTINDDLNNFHLYCTEDVELIVCMGDTLTHLETKEDVNQLFEGIYNHLEKEGKFILTYRDLSFELEELERFIPVKSDDSRIFTCFLEYEEEKVKVHDLIYEKENNDWNLKTSFYRKLRLPTDWVIDQLKEKGFLIKHSSSDKGLTTLIATKSS
jgi:SAM-dependent methyltransferase